MKKLFKRRFTLLEVVMLLAMVIVGAGIYAWAATTVPNIFTSGTTAKSSEVNANFSALATAIDAIKTACPGNSANDVMVKVGPLCVDKYEASIWSAPDGSGTAYGEPTFGLTILPGTFPANGNWTTPLYAVSKPGVLPSSSVTWFQAQQACALSGKRLLTNAEWQMAAAGTPDPGTDNGTTDCNVSSGNPVNTGSRSNCVSKWMVNDMVGNVWEWVADWMQGNGTAGNNWAPTNTFSMSAGTDYGTDMMFGTNPAAGQGIGSANFPAALLRGGNWYGGTFAGVFALRAFDGPPSSGDFGFRCAR
ncbi:MAG: SUMF1/EgtB/PvdO family nonheme iron enzyme [Nitrospirae bacterium]|nr:SUMF1/EgtB/PvdO family nonheme iron enzyme [Nitrospirota bacterium]